MPKKPLTPAIVQRIVIANTPAHPPSAAPNTLLKTLGVVSATIASIHKAGIQTDVAALGWTIKQKDIKSTPVTTVAACRDSVLIHAT